MGPAPALLDRRLLFFTGKGGVGKSTVTAATALLAAEHGKRVLLVEVDAKNNLTALFEHAPVGFEPRQVHPGVYAMQMDTEASLREYLKVQAKVPVFGRIGPIARAFDFVATAAPGVKEILTVGKVCWELRESLAGRADWDLIVVDAAATGHVISQLDAPGAIQELVQVGPIRNQTGWMVDLLSDPSLTALNVVTSPEEMPVNETIELVATARQELDVPLGVVIVNRVLPELFTHADEAVFDALREPGPAEVLQDRAGHGVDRGARRGAARRLDASEPLGAPGPPARGGRPAVAADPVPVRPRPRAAGHPHGGGGAGPGARMTDDAPSLAALLSTREVVVFCGSGGVGKTSVAAASALTAAARLGGKVLVLTIDPARRLADALGLEAFGNVARRVPLDAYAELGVEPRGELWAAMLDTKRSWDELVLRHAPDEATAYRILDNRMYHNVTSRFVQSHDYIAMERLYEIHASGEYDLIIIDTPPTRNAIDFLEAPARMAEFFGGRLLRWLTMPYRLGGGRGGRMFNAASRPFYQMADRVLGSQFLQDIAEFFLNFQSMYGGFVERAQSVEQLLHDRRTTFAVVTTLEGAPLREAETFCRELATRGFDLGALVLNKVLPDYLLSPDGEHAADVLGRDHDALARELAETGGADAALADTASTARVLRTLADSFHNYEVVARREAELRTELSRLARPGPEVVVSVPSFDADIADVRGLARIGEVLFAHGAPVVPGGGGAGTIPP